MTYSLGLLIPQEDRKDRGRTSKKENSKKSLLAKHFILPVATNNAKSPRGMTGAGN
jgi:hypothetical protein